MARVYYQSSSTGISNNTSTTFSTKTWLSFTPTTGKSYAIFWGAVVWAVNTTSVDVQVKLVLNPATSNTDLQLYNLESKDTTDRISVSGISVYTAPSTAELAFHIQYASESGTTTASITDAYITVLELFPDELFSTDIVSSFTNTTTSPQDYVSITLPPGDWYIAANLGQRLSSGGTIAVEVHDGTTSYCQVAYPYIQDTTNFVPYSALVPLTLATTKTIKLRGASNGSAQLTCRYATILALNKANFRQSWSVSSLSQQNTTNTTAVQKASLTVQPTYAVAHLILANWTVRSSSTTYSVYADFRKAGTTVFVTLPLREPPNISSEMVSGFAETETQTTSSVNWTLQFYSENALATATMEDAAIVILNLGTDLPPKGYSFGYILE